MAETFGKKEREKKKEQKRKEKLLRKENRKDNATDGSLDSMMAYVDENGVIRDTPPNPDQKFIIDASEIALGVPKREEGDYDPTLEGSINYYESFFVHHSDISGLPATGKKVTFEKERGKKGWVAVRVKIL